MRQIIQNLMVTNRKISCRLFELLDLTGHYSFIIRKHLKLKYLYRCEEAYDKDENLTYEDLLQYIQEAEGETRRNHY